LAYVIEIAMLIGFVADMKMGILFRKTKKGGGLKGMGGGIRVADQKK